MLCGNRLSRMKNCNKTICLYKPHVEGSIQTSYGFRQNYRMFHTTTPKRAVPPIVWIILRPILKVGAIVFGRRIRKWWQGMSAKERQKILSTLRQGNRTIVGNFKLMWFVGHMQWYF